MIVPTTVISNCVAFTNAGSTGTLSEIGIARLWLTNNLGVLKNEFTEIAFCLYNGFSIGWSSNTSYNSVDTTLTRASAGVISINQTPAATSQVTNMTFSSGADSASNIGHRVKINMNGTDYWFPCSTTAF